LTTGLFIRARSGDSRCFALFSKVPLWQSWKYLQMNQKKNSCLIPQKVKKMVSSAGASFSWR